MRFISLILICNIDEKKIILKIIIFSSFDIIVLFNIKMKYCINMIFIYFLICQIVF